MPARGNYPVPITRAIIGRVESAIRSANAVAGKGCMKSYAELGDTSMRSRINSPLRDGRPLTAQGYEAQARLTDLKGESTVFPLLGLFGETGSLLSEVKKKQRDVHSYVGYADAVIEELGDVLWYLTACAARAGLSLASVAHRFLYGTASVEPEATLPLARLQHPKLPMLDCPTPAFERTLLELAGAVGTLVSELGTGTCLSKDFAAERLERILRLLVAAADEAGVTVESAAERNLAKIFDRWPSSRDYPALFDHDDDPEEQIPRRLAIDVFERSVAGGTYVYQRCNGINIGNRPRRCSRSASRQRHPPGYRRCASRRRVPSTTRHRRDSRRDDSRPGDAF